MTVEAETSVCTRCGMPLGYDRLVEKEDAVRGEGLCVHCTDARSDGRYDPIGGSPAVLNLLLSTYLRGRPVVRGLAAVVRKTGMAPEPVRRLAQVIGALPRRPHDQECDALVLYSGGKDSSTMLIGLAATGLRLRAWMLDQGYQSGTAIANARALCERLNIPLVIERPERGKMDSLFRIGFGIDGESNVELIKAASAYGSACWPCFSTIAARAASYCSEQHIPFCFIGTQPGQNRLDLNGKPGLAGIVPRTETVVRRFVDPLRAYAAAIDPEAAELLRLDSCETLLLPYFEFVPLPDRPTQLARLAEVGWTMPNNTGACSTNCMMNELGRHIMRRRFGYDLYQIIEANERRMRRTTTPVEPAPLDGDAVIRGARLMRMGADEAARHGVEREEGK
jgi:hypothetical protein